MRFFFFLCSLLSVSGQVVLSPSSPAVSAGKAITLHSSTPVSWSLQGTGSLSNVTSTSATFTAPTGVVPQNQMLGCPVGPNDSIFNTPVDKLPVHAKSSVWIGAAIDLFFFEKDNWGISYADATTPTRSLKTFYGSATYNGFVFPSGGPNLKRQNGNHVGTAGFKLPPDHHVMTVRRTDCTFYESYNDYMNGVVKTCHDGTSGCNVQSAMTYPAMAYAVKTGLSNGTNAGGVPLAPTLWHLDEIQSGTIKHAIAFTTNSANLLFNSYLWPAGVSAGGCDPAICPNAMPVGARLRLKASFNTGSICKSGVAAEDAACNTMLNGLKRYGMILVDTGSPNAALLSSDVTEDPAVAAAVQAIRASKMGFSNFEAVDESSLEVNAASYQVCPLNWTCAHGKNSFEVPLNQAIVIARTSAGASASTAIAIQPVAIGLGVPSVTGIAAGSYSYQIPFWVNGSSNQQVNWRLVSGVGSVTSGGLYTPPIGTSLPGELENAVLQGVSAADTVAKVTLRLTVIPTSSSGTLRIDSGAVSPTTDASGNAWSPDIGMDGGTSTVATDYPHWNKTNVPASLAYESSQGSVNDIGSTIIVPNGSYDVHLLFGMLASGACNSSCSSWLNYQGQWDRYNYAPYILEAQGNVQSSSFDWGSASNYKFQTPVDAHIPAMVTNNLLQVYVRNQSNDVTPYLTPQSSVSSKYAQLNGMEITRTAAGVSGHWTINTQGQSSIGKGQTLKPFSIIDSGTGRNDASWTIASGPAGATLSGSTLSLGSTTTPNGTPIVVKASDGTYSATASIATPLNGSTAYAYRRVLTIPHSLVGGSDLVSFPVVVSLSDKTLASTANGGHVANGAGYDIVVASDAAGANLLHWQVESYNASTGAWIAYVQVPKVSHTVDTTIYLLYGGAASATSKAESTAVWDKNFEAVYHFGSGPVSVHDSTANANSALKENVLYSPNGVIGGSVMSANSDVELPSKVLDQPAGTLAAWVSSLQAEDVYHNWYVASQAGNTANDYFRLGWSGTDNQFEAVWSSASSGTSHLGFSPAKVNLKQQLWNHVVYTWDSKAGVQNLYFNGLLVGSLAGKIPILSSSKPVQLASYTTPGMYSLSGSLDEVRFSNVVRSKDWVAASYRSEAAPGSFVLLGGEIKN